MVEALYEALNKEMDLFDPLSAGCSAGPPERLIKRI